MLPVDLEVHSPSVRVEESIFCLHSWTFMDIHGYCSKISGSLNPLVSSDQTFIKVHMPRDVIQTSLLVDEL